MTFGAVVCLGALLAIPILAFLFARAERRAVVRLREFVSPRLLPQLSATVNRTRRLVRFGFLMLGLAFAIVSLAQPQWGYIYEDVKRKGLDLLFAVDTSRSMLSNDVQSNQSMIWTQKQFPKVGRTFLKGSISPSKHSEKAPPEIAR